MAVVEPDIEEVTVIVINKRQHSVELRNETESAVTIYITPKDSKGESECLPKSLR